MRIERLKREQGIAPRWSVFPLHPAIPAEGMALSDLFPGRAASIGAMHERLVLLAREEGLPMSATRGRTFNSRLAQELGKWAESRGAGDAFRDAVFRAYFVDVANIGQVDELVRIADSVGLPPAEARSVLMTRKFAPDVDADWRRAMALGVTAVPAHLCGDRRLVGFAPYGDYLRLIGKGSSRAA